MANRKARAKRRAVAQRAAREERREVERATAARSAATGAARETWQAVVRPRIERHDAAVLPLVRELREARATWQQIADWLTEAAVTPPGGSGTWSASAVWRIARRHGLAGRLPAEPAPGPVEVAPGQVQYPDGRVVFTRSSRYSLAPHDAQVLPTIRKMRARGASWRAIAEHLEAEGVISPGQRDAHIRAQGWTATGVWRIGRRHGIA